MRRLSGCRVTIILLIFLFGVSAASGAEKPAKAPPLPYDLAQVKHLENFAGSARARELLARQGFVVTDEQFQQIFQPYLPAARVQIPVFITVDSAWHTYHVLLEECVQRVEGGQARLLKRFSERLHQVAASRQGPSQRIYHDLAAFAAVGWAVQDSTCLQRLPTEERAVVGAALQAMQSGGPALFFGLHLQPENFRPAGFYTKTPALSQYFVARRWYATAAFRLVSEAETFRALHLTMLVESDAELKKLHGQLTMPAQAMVGPSDDLGVAEYSRLAARLAKGPLTEQNIAQIHGSFRREASNLPGPRINDQFLLPEQFAARKEATKGLRLFGPCQLPSAILFQQTTEPAIARRGLPSGVDVFAAGPLACDAGRRTLKTMERDKTVYDAICRVECGNLPDSLHGQAMQLLRLLQEPLPEAAPAALRAPAWQDKQLSTALGAWAEERHTWVLHTKPAGAAGSLLEEPPGYVSPYPQFYRCLGQLARRAAALLPQVAAEPDFVAAGQEWMKARRPRVQEATPASEPAAGPVWQAESENGDVLDRMEQALTEYFQAMGKDIEAASVLDRANARHALDAAARRCAEQNRATDSDRRYMRAFAVPADNGPQLLPAFADLCDQLATIADKELAGQPLDSADIRLIKTYGLTLAQLHFYQGMTSMSPRDDFPCVAPVFNNPGRGQTLYVGVSRPEAIYVVLFTGKRLVLHRGAVLSYREFSRPPGDGPDDAKWREEISEGRVPSPPAWTAAFRCASSPQEQTAVLQDMVARVREGRLAPEACPVWGRELTHILIERLLKRREAPEEERSQLLETILDRAVDEDVPDLLDRVLPVIPENDLWRLSRCLSGKNCGPCREKLLMLVHHPRPAIAAEAVFILGSLAEDIDVAALAKRYDQQPRHVRAGYCRLIGQSQQPGPEGQRILAAGLRDQAWEVRYQAAAVVAWRRIADADIRSAVRAGLREEQPQAAAAMVHAAVALGLNDAAPQMLARLRKQIASSKLSDEKEDKAYFPLQHGDIKSLTTELIAGLGDLRYKPARETFLAFIFPNSPALARYKFGDAAFKALLRLEPERKEQLLSDVFQDSRCPDDMLQTAIVQATETDEIKYIKTMLPLFEDLGRTVKNGRESQADRAAWHINRILERADLRDPESAKLFERIRSALLKHAHGPGAVAALQALKYLDPATAARESLSVALDTKMDKKTRRCAIALLEEAPRPWPIRELLPLLHETPADDRFLEVSYPAAQTIGTLCMRLDSAVPQEAETLRAVQTDLNEMLKGPHYEIAVEGIARLSRVAGGPFLQIAGNRSLPYATRAYVLSRMGGYYSPERARELIPLLSDQTRPDNKKPTIALCAANVIASMVEKDRWDGKEPPAKFIRKARAWAEAAESR